MMSAPIACCTCIETSAVNRCRVPSRCERNVTPSSSTWARRLAGGAITSAAAVVESMASVFLKPAPRLITWKPPLSVKVGPAQFMNAPRPPAPRTMSTPGCRYRWYAFASSAWAPSSAIASGSTIFSAAWVATGMKAGVSDLAVRRAGGRRSGPRRPRAGR